MSTQQTRSGSDKCSGNSSGVMLGGGNADDSQIVKVEHSQRLRRRFVQQCADFRDIGNFPPFLFLPEENSISLDFYTTSDGFNYLPRKHWCFLAEVVDVESFLRLRLIVRDKSGTTVPIAFHTGDRGAGFATKVQPGQTVAVLYALQHGFLDCTMGIRLEDCNGIKLFPLPLDALLRLNDQIHRYSTEIDQHRTCHGCDEQKKSLQKCGKCLLFWYCGKTCQNRGWVERGHKQDCKTLRDDDLRAMLLLEWSNFEDFLQFPISNRKRAMNELA